MMKKKNVAEAVDHVARLRLVLQAMGIRRGTFVDDQFSPSFDDAWARSRAAVGSKSKELSAAWGIGSWEDDSGEEDRPSAERQWSARDRTAQRNLVKTIATLTAEVPGEGELAADVTFFGRFWPQDTCPLDEIAPEEFDAAYRDEWLLARGPSILFLDLNFGDGDKSGGLRILHSVLQADRDGKTICVIFTRWPGSEDADYWSQLAAAEGIEPEAAVVISKTAAESIEAFEPQLRRALLNGLAPDLFKWAKDIALRALSNALSNTRIEGDVLNAVVLESSENEGVDPTETLFRLIDEKFRLERDSLVLAEESRRGFAGLKTKLEALASIAPTDDSGPPLSSRVQRLMRSYLYREEAGRSEWKTPIWLGDLWEVTFEGDLRGEFVLIAQPCDIILRSEDGCRSQEWAILVPLKADQGHSETTVKLSYYDKESLKPSWADLKRARVASANVLDLVAMFGPRIKRSEIPDLRVRTHVHASVAKRIHHLADWLERIPRSATAAAHSLALFSGPGRIAKLSTTSSTFTFHCGRIGRIEPEFARLLLQKYGNFVARHALPHDFARYRR